MTELRVRFYEPLAEPFRKALKLINLTESDTTIEYTEKQDGVWVEFNATCKGADPANAFYLLGKLHQVFIIEEKRMKPNMHIISDDVRGDWKEIILLTPQKKKM